MRRMICLISIIIAAIACSKNENQEPKCNFVGLSGYPSLCDILEATSDTDGLKIFTTGNVVSKENISACAVGAKHDKTWYGFFSGSDSTGYKEEFIYMGKNQFEHVVEIDTGYGRTAKVELTTCFSFWHDNNTFAVTLRYGRNSTGFFTTIFINDSKETQNANFFPIIPWFDEYYYTRLNSGDECIIDADGNYIFSPLTAPSFSGLEISLYECISIDFDEHNSQIIIERINIAEAYPESTIWHYELSIGKTMNGKKPKISYTRSLDGNILTLEASATNYDGTQETSFFQIDINTEEIIANDGFTINQAQ